MGSGCGMAPGGHGASPDPGGAEVRPGVASPPSLPVTIGVVTSSETRSRILRLEDGAQVEYTRAFLLVEAGPDEGLEHPLKDRPVVIGRDPQADLTLEDSTVSREHARLEPTDGGWQLRDLESKSGTFVNGVKVEVAEIQAGQRIRMGETELVLQVSRATLSAPRHKGSSFEGLIGESRPMRELFGLIRKVGPLDLPLLLYGESGTGKERLARALHANGPNPAGPYVVVDCTLLGQGEHMRSELFGHVKGAFTGADRPREGAFVRADGGTLFLDEVGELPLDLQPQLLRVLQEGEVRPLGGTQVRRIRTRVISATNRNLDEMVAAGHFRQDLFYRLSALTLDVPPLRARESDVLLLARALLPPGTTLDAAAEDRLRGHSWPGNVRELEFVLQQAAALADGGVVRAENLRLREPTGTLAVVRPIAPAGPAPLRAPSGRSASEVLETQRDRVAELETQAILEALEKSGGNRNKAADLLGVSRATLFRKLKKLRGDE